MQSHTISKLTTAEPNPGYATYLVSRTTSAARRLHSVTIIDRRETFQCKLNYLRDSDPTHSKRLFSNELRRELAGQSTLCF